MTVGRTIPAELQAHLDQAATTTTRLLKITLTDGRVFGLCMLDRDILYDDGTGTGGEVNYVATNGFDPSTFSADLGYTVANAEGYALISDDVDGIELEDIEAGALDDAEWVCYLVNFNDLTPGRHVILDAGDVGEVRVRFGMVWLPELLGYMMRLKQPIGGVWSRTCRAIFGTPADSQTGCGIDLEPLWAYGTVQSVGAESNRIFTGDIVSADSPPTSVTPGRVQFLDGDNAGREYAIEEQDGLELTLAEPTNFAIQVGDAYRSRPDCGKRYAEDCIARWNNGPNFKGEPKIPTGDGTSVQTPGAELGAGARYSGPGVAVDTD